MSANPLIYRITQGDREAFNSLCRERYASLVSYAGMFLSTEWAKDVVQDVLFAVWENRSRLDCSTDLQAYLIRSVYNRCMNILERCNTAGRYASWYRYRISSILAAELAPDQCPLMAQIYNRDLGKSLEKAISSLPGRCEEIFRLNYIEHVPEKEIAEKLGISLRTVENQIYNALKLLRTQLESVQK